MNIPSALRRAASGWLARGHSARLQRDLAAMASDGKPIVAGPWVGEVGFELLYWVPFLAWFVERFNVAPERLLVVSRGGTSSWYRPFASRYAEIFEQVTPQLFRREDQARPRRIGEQQQTGLTDLERELVETAAFRNGIEDFSLLHPARMYDLLNPFWSGHLSTDWVHRHARYRRLQAPDDAGVRDLPTSYVAVKFYFNDCFPASERNRTFVRDVLRTLSAGGPVVWLSSGLNIDDHSGVRIDDEGLHRLPEGTDPARNLQVQSAIVARARAFVGTYGGFAYLPPFYGIPSITFYEDRRNFLPKHQVMAQSVFDAIGSGGLLQVCDALDGLAPVVAAGSGRG